MHKQRAKKAQARGEVYKPEDAPRVFSTSLWMWEAFNYLSNCRQSGPQAPQPLTVADIYAMSQILGIDARDKREDFLYIMTSLDRVFIEHVDGRIKVEQAKAARKAKQNSKR